MQCTKLRTKRRTSPCAQALRTSLINPKSEEPPGGHELKPWGLFSRAPMHGPARHERRRTKGAQSKNKANERKRTKPLGRTKLRATLGGLYTQHKMKESLLKPVDTLATGMHAGAGQAQRTRPAHKPERTSQNTQACTKSSRPMNTHKAMNKSNKL